MFTVILASTVGRFLGSIALPALSVAILLVRIFGSRGSTTRARDIDHSKNSLFTGGNTGPQIGGAATPPPGWYPDPGGAFGDRWWDGSQWTAQVREPSPFR